MSAVAVCVELDRVELAAVVGRGDLEAHVQGGVGQDERVHHCQSKATLLVECCEVMEIRRSSSGCICFRLGFAS